MNERLLQPVLLSHIADYRAKLSDPEVYMADHEDKLLIPDEIHRVQESVLNLRDLAD